MAFTIMNNSSAMLALGETNKNNNALSKTLKKVSSGMRLNSAGDGAAEYAVSKKMQVMIRSLGQDIDNAEKGINLIRIAEGGMQNIVDELRDMKAMAINSANDHNCDADRAILQREFASRIASIDSIASTTNYNGKILMDGRYWYKEYDDIDSDSGKLLANSLMAVRKGNNNLYSAFALGQTQLTKSKLLLGNAAKNSSPIVEGETTNLVFDGSADKYKENEITGLFPAATGLNKGIGYGGIEGYSPVYYKIITKLSNGKYNIYSTTEKEYPYSDKPHIVQNKQYTKIPAVGTAVTTTANTGLIDYYSAIVKSEPGSGRRIAEANNSGLRIEYGADERNKYTSVEIDFDNAKINGKNASFPNDFHGQGFSITLKSSGDKDYRAFITSIIFDANLDMGEGILLSEKPQSSSVVGDEDSYAKTLKSLQRSAYIIGIKGASSSKDMGEALLSGLKKAQESWGANYSMDAYGGGFEDSRANDIARTLPYQMGMSVVKYGNSYVLKMGHKENNGITRMVINNGVVGMSGTISKLPDTTDPTDQTDPTDPTNPPGPTDPTDPTNPPGPTDPTEPTDPPEDIRKGHYFEGNPLIIHYGPKSSQHLRVYINDMRTKAMGLQNVAIDPREKALEAMGKLDEALDYALNEITRMGAYQTKLQYIMDNNTTAQENVTNAESIICDADMAKEMSNYIKNNILTQASQAMLANANQNSSIVLSLLQ